MRLPDTPCFLRSPCRHTLALLPENFSILDNALHAYDYRFDEQSYDLMMSNMGLKSEDFLPTNLLEMNLGAVPYSFIRMREVASRDPEYIDIQQLRDRRNSLIMRLQQTSSIGNTASGLQGYSAESRYGLKMNPELPISSPAPPQEQNVDRDPSILLLPPDDPTSAQNLSLHQINHSSQPEERTEMEEPVTAVLQPEEVSSTRDLKMDMQDPENAVVTGFLPSLQALVSPIADCLGWVVV